MLRRGSLRWTLAVALAAGASLAAASALGSPRTPPRPTAGQVVASSDRTPRCFGAASLDPGRRCFNPRLSRMVVPRPEQARGGANAPCATVDYQGALKLCTFGAPQRDGTATIALVGDSHAQNWRGAVARMANARGWHGVSIALGGCPYSTITRVIPEPLRSHCAERNREVPGWFAEHPEVSTVFVAQISGVPFVSPAGASQFEGQVEAYVRAWRALPATVRHIVVIRDTPKALPATHRCISAAIGRGEPAGWTCRMPRSAVVDRDAAAAAARRLDSPRESVVNLLDHFCDHRWCYPVIGGALVQKDLNHLTNTFIETLAPYLLRDVHALSDSWQ